MTQFYYYDNNISYFPKCSFQSLYCVYLHSSYIYAYMYEKSFPSKYNKIIFCRMGYRVRTTSFVNDTMFNLERFFFFVFTSYSIIFLRNIISRNCLFYFIFRFLREILNFGRSKTIFLAFFFF